MIGAIKTLRELETIATLPNHYRDGINCSVSNLNGIRSYHKRVQNTKATTN
ncbi:hypothetical protein ACQJ6I_04235 [Helicobacter pylori]